MTIIPGSIPSVISLSLLILLTALPPVFAQAVSAPETRQFRILPELSVLRIKVGRAGLLARLGHNHVIVNRSITGMVLLAQDQSSAHLAVPINGLVVDEPAERQRAGKGYESVPDAKARTDTHTNMLRPEVLDGERWPEILIDVKPVAGNGDPQLFEVILTFKGSAIALELPATLSVSNERLEVHAQFSLDHRQLGLRPFSAVGGTLRVAESLEFELLLIADATDEVQ